MCQPLRNQAFAVILLALLVEASYVFHRSELVEQKADREHVAFIDVVLGKARIAVYNMCLPQKWRQVLGCPTNSCCCGITAVIAVHEEVL